jgi:hypothetical protein
MEPEHVGPWRNFSCIFYPCAVCPSQFTAAAPAGCVCLLAAALSSSAPASAVNLLTNTARRETLRASGAPRRVGPAQGPPTHGHDASASIGE